MLRYDPVMNTYIGTLPGLNLMVHERIHSPVIGRMTDEKGDSGVRHGGHRVVAGQPGGAIDAGFHVSVV